MADPESVHHAIREVLEEQFVDYDSYMAYIRRLENEEATSLDGRAKV